MRIAKAKIQEIEKAYRAGEVKVLGNGNFSVPSRFFVMGITPRMVAQVVDKLER